MAKRSFHELYFQLYSNSALEIKLEIKQKTQTTIFFFPPSMKWSLLHGGLYLPLLCVEKLICPAWVLAGSIITATFLSPLLFLSLGALSEENGGLLLISRDSQAVTKPLLVAALSTICKSPIWNFMRFVLLKMLEMYVPEFNVKQ